MPASRQRSDAAWARARRPARPRPTSLRPRAARRAALRARGAGVAARRGAPPARLRRAACLCGLCGAHVPAACARQPPRASAEGGAVRCAALRPRRPARRVRARHRGARRAAGAHAVRCVHRWAWSRAAWRVDSW